MQPGDFRSGADLHRDGAVVDHIQPDSLPVDAVVLLVARGAQGSALAREEPLAGQEVRHQQQRDDDRHYYEDTSTAAATGRLWH
jgi:hypothetical protein